MPFIGNRFRSALLVSLATSSAIVHGLVKVDAQQVEGVCFCDASGGIAIAQLVRAVSVALGSAGCPATPLVELLDCEGVPNGTTCDAGMDGVVLTCEDGACASCAPIDEPNPALVDNGDGTVTDRGTCLVWEMKTDAMCPGPDNCADPHDVGNQYTWTTHAGGGVELNGTVATEFLDVLNDTSRDGCFAGHCDWRLPSSAGFVTPTGEPDEIGSILDRDQDGLWIDPIFGPTGSGDYWTSTTDSSTGGAFAWVFRFDSGQQAPIQKVFANLARAVRGPPERTGLEAVHREIDILGQ